MVMEKNMGVELGSSSSYMRRFSLTTTVIACCFATKAPMLVGAVPQEPDMFLVKLPESTSPGGRCMDGTMAGYYIREGINPDLFVIYLKGGGACTTKETCDPRANNGLGSSNNWVDSMVGNREFLNPNCDGNPDFCQATAVYVPYCTSDTHRGTNDEPSALSFGYYFDGHYNFVAIIEKLIDEEGLGDAGNVLLTGGSAGAVGALFNVDWLADRLPNANVKAAPYAGWYTPGALEDDLPTPFNPSDYAHFARGENGNPAYDLIQAGGIGVDIWKIAGSTSPDCLAAYGEDKLWACASAHFAYRYIKSPIFMVHTQYDSNQIFSRNSAPTVPADDTELDTVKRYIQMWGNATRESLQQIVNDDVAFPKPHKDGVFSASCITHGTPLNVDIDGYTAMPLIRDWFFQYGQYTKDQYKLVETSCSPLEGNEDYVIPCNPMPACAYNPSSSNPRETVEKCAKKLHLEGCLQSYGPRKDCLVCARDNKDTLQDVGCTTVMVQRICVYAEENEIFDELDGQLKVDNDVFVDTTLDEIDDNTAVTIDLEDSGDSSAVSVPFTGPSKSMLLLLYYLNCFA